VPADGLDEIIHEIDRRREAGIADPAVELRRRVDELGDRPLDTRPLQDTMLEVFEAFTPAGFALYPIPDECRVLVTGGQQIMVAGTVVDATLRQTVGTIARHLDLDAGTVDHQFLRVQKPYRGGGLALLLLDRSFRFYERVGLQRVTVHAALETGRWYWARLGFEFEHPLERVLIASWGVTCLRALGEPLIAPDAPARRWAQLGSGDPPREVTLEQLHDAVSTFVAHVADPAHEDTYQQLGAVLSARLGADWLDMARFELLAAANGIEIDEPIALGRAIMLTGIDWHGVFDLAHKPAREAFNEELQSRLRKLAET
jgi:GNAT superfamily N-acetyltransferase